MICAKFQNIDEKFGTTILKTTQIFNKPVNHKCFRFKFTNYLHSYLLKIKQSLLGHSKLKPYKTCRLSKNCNLD